MQRSVIQNIKLLFYTKTLDYLGFAQVVELADTADSKSADREIVRVQLPPWAPLQYTTHITYITAKHTTK